MTHIERRVFGRPWSSGRLTWISLVKVILFLGFWNDHGGSCYPKGYCAILYCTLFQSFTNSQDLDASFIVKLTLFEKNDSYVLKTRQLKIHALISQVCNFEISFYHFKWISQLQLVKKSIYLGPNLLSLHVVCRHEYFIQVSNPLMKLIFPSF